MQGVVFLTDPKAKFHGKPLTDSDIVIGISSVYKPGLKLNVRPILQLTKVESERTGKVLLQQIQAQIPKFRWPRSHVRVRPPPKAKKGDRDDSDNESNSLI